VPATFAHCLMAKQAIEKIRKDAKKDVWSEKIDYVKKIGEKNNFVMMGAAAPDYPYLSEILTTVVLPIRHTWADRMHYENTLSFIEEGVKSLSKIDRNSEAFSIRLSWFLGFVSHVLADSYIHPVVNSVVRGCYRFTSEFHGKCELVQDIYIFQQLTGEEIIDAAPRTGNLGYLRILDECSDPADDEGSRIHPEIRTFWKELLVIAHPFASEYFSGIDPDVWHHNYKAGVNFVVDQRAIFRHVAGLTGRQYKRWSEISTEDKAKYIEKVLLPTGKTSNYGQVFKDTVKMIADIWFRLVGSIDTGNVKEVAEYIKDWDLDNGVDISQVELWEKKGGAT
jgi:hypothetical protein